MGVSEPAGDKKTADNKAAAEAENKKLAEEIKTTEYWGNKWIKQNLIIHNNWRIKYYPLYWEWTKAFKNDKYFPKLLKCEDLGCTFKVFRFRDAEYEKHLAERTK